MTTEESRPWLRRPGIPTAVVMFAVAAVLAVAGAFSIIDMIGSPPPSAEFEYGPFNDLDVLIGLGALVLIFAVAGWWGVTRGSELGITRVSALLVVFGPIGWGLGLLDSLTFDLTNSIGPTSSVVAMLLLVVAPIVTVVAIVAAFAEYAASRGQRTQVP